MNNSPIFLLFMVLTGTFLFSQIVCKKPSFDFTYSKWESFPLSDVAKYRASLERTLNVHLSSSFLYTIHHFTRVQTKGMPIFQFNASFVIQPTEPIKQKTPRFINMERYSVPQHTDGTEVVCDSLFQLNPWVKLFNVTKLTCQ